MGKHSVPRPEVREPYTADTLTDVALGVFRQRGFDATSIVDIADAAGLTKSSLYHHVAGKEELLARGLGRALDQLFAVLAEEGATRGRSVERLAYVVRRSIEVELAMLAEVTVLLRARGNSDTERRAIARRREFDEHVAELVRTAQSEGDICEDIEASLIGRLVFGMLNSLTEWYQPGGQVTPEQVACAVDALVFNGIRSSPRTSSRARRAQRPVPPAERSVG